MIRTLIYELLCVMLNCNLKYSTILNVILLLLIYQIFLVYRKTIMVFNTKLILCHYFSDLFQCPNEKKNKKAFSLCDFEKMTLFSV